MSEVCPVGSLMCIVKDIVSGLLQRCRIVQKYDIQ